MAIYSGFTHYKLLINGHIIPSGLTSALLRRPGAQDGPRLFAPTQLLRQELHVLRQESGSRPGRARGVQTWRLKPERFFLFFMLIYGELLFDI